MQNKNWSLRVFFKGVIGYLCCKKISLIEKLFVLGIGVLYFLIPLDIIPDFFLPFGFLDDFGFVTLLLAYMNHRLNKIRESEQLIGSSDEDPGMGN